ncbi:MAG: 5-formyltetrahydrofolate cyclo-ligase [Gammaproteobacteria bacterium]|nr:MAG: 5-formyltetrahydrofolate cyclo-ligase [Gammaproteobacteria bacterium]
MSYSSRTTERKRLRKMRSSLSPAKQKEYSYLVSSHIYSSKEFKKSKHIAIYWPFDGEINPTLVIKMAEKMDKVFYLPILAKGKNRRMTFARACNGTKLKKNRYGIPEPVTRKRKKASHLDLILTPLVGFDSMGNRLGMGSGYYDATLSFLNRRKHWKKPLLMGVAYELQRIENIPPKPWDIPLAGVYTEKGVNYPKY